MVLRSQRRNLHEIPDTRMATKEINRTSKKKRHFKQLSNSFTSRQFLDYAYEQLLFKEFLDCIKTCEAGIVNAKLELNGNPDIVEALCVVGIQAYAELNNWQKVLPFVQNVYTSIEDCPFTVIQLCILLHAKVEEFSQCYAIGSIWLKAAKNFGDPNYYFLVELYITNILVPRGQHSLIQPFLEVCQGLNSEQKQRLYTDYFNTEGGITPPIDTESLTRDIVQQKRPIIVKDSWLTSIIKKVKFALFGNAPLASFNLVKFTLIAACVYLLTFGHQRGFLTSNFDKVGLVFKGMLKAFQSILGPKGYIMR